jgi:hypothetical protein
MGDYLKRKSFTPEEEEGFAKSCAARAAEWQESLEDLQKSILSDMEEIAQLKIALACPHKRLEVLSGFMCTTIVCRDCGFRLEDDL